MTTFLTFTYNFIAIMAFICSIATIYYSRSPHTALCFMAGLFVSIALLLLFHGVMFASIAYIIVYVGAILVLFLFVILLIDAGKVETNVVDNRLLNPINITVILLMLLSLYGVSYFMADITFTPHYLISDVQTVSLLNGTLTAPDGSLVIISQLQALALELYTLHATSLMIAGMILLFSLFAVTVLSKTHSSKSVGLLR